MEMFFRPRQNKFSVCHFVHSFLSEAAAGLAFFSFAKGRRCKSDRRKSGKTNINYYISKNLDRQYNNKRTGITIEKTRIFDIIL